MATHSVADAAYFLTRLGAFLLGAGLIGLGGMCAVMPEAAAQIYGLPSKGDTRWVVVAGARDFGLGVAALALLAFMPRALRIYAPAILILPLLDAYLTITLGGTAMDAATHIVGTAAIGILSACAWLDPSLDDRVKRE